MNRYQNLLVLIFLCFGFSLSAQNYSVYQPLQSQVAINDQIASDMEQRYQKDQAAVGKKFNKEIKAQYQRRYEGMLYRVEEDHFITDTKFTRYFQDILDQIIAANPSLQGRNIRLLIGRYNWPNASCHGEGSLVINLGLISRLENTDQVAFVLCHELSHDYLEHVNHAIEGHVENFYGKATQKKLKKLAKQKYNTYDQAASLAQKLTFDLRRHSRLFETEADSLAVVWMANTSYNPRAAIQVLEILDQVDQPKRPQLIDFKQHFDSEFFQLKDRWLETESGNNFTYLTDQDKQLKDSLKTHPDCEKRIQILSSSLSSSPTEISADETFQQYIRLADFEMIEGAYAFRQYGQALFHTLQLLEEQPEDIYLHSMVLKCLFELYEHQRTHELGKVLALPNRRYPKNYNQFLRFLHELRLRDLAKLGYYYGLKQGDRFSQHEEFRVAHLFCASLVLDKEDWTGLQQQYLSDFPQGDFQETVRGFDPLYD